MDNLKLGYGGTKTEMQRLLQDAQKLTGIKYNIDDLDDVYNAIHAIQVEMGVTGTTSEEAAETLSGSWGAVKAASKNAMIAIASGEGVEEALDVLEDTICTWLENAMPVFGRIIWSYGKTFAKYLTPGGLLTDDYMQELRQVTDEYTRLGGSMEQGKVDTDLMIQAQKNLDAKIVTIPEHVNKARKSIENYLAPDGVYQTIGMNVTTGIADGMLSSEGITALFNASKKVKEYVQSQLQGQLKVHSPSRLMADEVGQYIPSGIALGMKENVNELTKATNYTASSIVGAFSGGRSGATLADSIVSGIGTIASGQKGGQPIVLHNYLYPNGPKMGTVSVDTYDTYKRRLG